MQHPERLANLRAKAFEEIARAAKRGDTGEINRLGRVAEECDEVFELLAKFDARVRDIESALGKSQLDAKEGHCSGPETIKSVAPVVQETKMPPVRKTNGRQVGKEVRAAYVDRLNNNSGIHLRRRGEVKYETNSGKIVAIPFATEVPHRPGRWWLGLPDEKFDFIIMLCKSTSGELLDFVFPTEFVAEIWKSLSRDANRHVKFDLYRVGQSYELRAVGGVVKQIRQFLGRSEAVS